MTIPARRGAAVVLLLALFGLFTAGAAQAAPTNPAGPATPVNGARYYVVAQSFNGQPEFLFEIAQRLLGTGDRALEIFNLNQGRWEPGGLQVQKPEVIRPGWVLLLPPDARGAGVRTGPLPSFPAPDTGIPDGGTSSAAPTSATAPARDTAAPDTGKSGIPMLALWLPLAAAALLLLAALVWAARTGKLGALTRRRHRAAAPAHPDSSASWTVDRSLRVLATACAYQQRPLPGVYAVVVGPEQIRLRLAAPDEAPPTGWTAEHDGRTWVADLRDLQYAAVDDTRPEPYERLVTLGTTAEGRLLLNLAQAQGIVAVQGDQAMQRALVDQWTRELGGNPWSRRVAVLGVGFPAGVGGRARWLPDLAQLWDILAEVPAGVLLLARAPGGRDLARLGELAASPGGEWTVVVLGGAKQARWQFTVRPGGWLDTGFLPEPVRTGLEAGQPAAV